MDAVRLVEVSRQALRRGGGVAELMAEAWQAQALARAVGEWLAGSGPPELRGEARGLSEAGVRDCGVSGAGTLGVEDIRAARLSSVSDPRQTLLSLCGMLVEVGVALVAVASAVNEEGIYWQCMEAIDAADESHDRVQRILRRLPGPRDPTGEPGWE